LEENPTNSKESGGKFVSLDYFEIMKYYEETASATKARIWTVTSWILALNAAIIAYCFKIYLEHDTVTYLILFEVMFCLAGIALCKFTLFIIDDH
jgi:hypothetical protein